jgi:acid stress-induced BolA-like protein IbaG/YrbA
LRITIKYGESLAVQADVEPQEFTELVETVFASMANVAQQRGVQQNIMAQLARQQLKKNDNPTEA